MFYSIEEVLKFSQEELFELLKYKADIVCEDNYLIYSKSSSPKPMLCVHLDTINTHEKKKVTVDLLNVDNRKIIVGHQSMACLGADDRAGVWIAMKVIDYMESTGDYKYDIGFFCDEEIGGLGSANYDVSLCNTTAYIGLDRRSPGGLQEVALYGNDNDDLNKVFTDLGYSIANGSFTDASNISTDCDIACVNLSVGYDNEHTRKEVLYLDCMYNTLNNILNIK
jgi:di/tripeptidase